MLVKQAEPVLASLPLSTFYFLLFTFDFSIGLGGAVAQLGARLHGMQEVAGSIPASSTIRLAGIRSVERVPRSLMAGRSEVARLTTLRVEWCPEHSRGAPPTFV